MSEKLNLQESRYDRAERITWWDQSKLLNSKVLVVGAGALGNEIVKNLTMLGIGEIHVVDMDSIEHSNLARCVFFREEDEGQNKASVLSTKASAVNPDSKVIGHPLKVQELGSAFLDSFDLVLGALDNREARLWVNAAARRLGITWIDGAIEGIQGLVRTFPPEGPCYECTLGEVDWQILNHRKSCALLSPEAILSGKTPTNTTTASIISGVQCQEAVKILVGRADLSALTGKTWHYLGESMLTFISEITEDEYCNAHISALEITQEVSNPHSLRQLVQGNEDFTSIDLFDDFINIYSCKRCETAEINGLRSLLNSGLGKCSSCGDERESSTKTRFAMDDPILDKPFTEIIWPISELIYLQGSTTKAVAVRKAK
jgi:adenylyltransferase/sulfurtransferase